MSDSPQNAWNSRIVGHGEEIPQDLLENPANWRVHPKRQQQALEALLDEVGWVRHVIVNRTTGHLVDGHLRVRLAQTKGEPRIPVVYVELDVDEERLVLASLDPIASLAATDSAALMSLAASVSVTTDSKELNSMVTTMANLKPADPRSPTQEAIDKRTEEMTHQYETRVQKTFEAKCPDCEHEFLFGR
jgi:ParB-like chromosome segregation protein Spo0J